MTLLPIQKFLWDFSIYSVNAFSRIFKVVLTTEIYIEHNFLIILMMDESTEVPDLSKEVYFDSHLEQ